MRWSSIFVPFTLLATGVLAAEPASKQFQDFHKKALASTPIKLEDASYKKITALPRDYSVAVLLTAMDNRYACQMCREFGPEWDLLANSWTKGDKKGESRVIFATLDFNDGRDTFMSVSIVPSRPTMLDERHHLMRTLFPQLGLQTAPVLLFFQPTTGEFASTQTDPIRFDFNIGFVPS